MEDRATLGSDHERHVGFAGGSIPGYAVFLTASWKQERQTPGFGAEPR